MTMDSGILIFDLRLNQKSQIANPKSQIKELSLRELEALARALLTVLLALFDARIAGHQTGVLERGAKIVVVFEQRARNAMTHGARLSGRSSARYVNDDVEFARGIGKIQRLADDHPESLIREILLEGLAVDSDFPCAGSQINACG
jgi:hypothetical protein